MGLSSIFLSLPKERKFYSLIYVHLKELHTHCVYTTKWNLAGITCFGIRVNLWSYTHCLILSGRGLQTNFPFPLFGSSNQHENIRLESESRKNWLEVLGTKIFRLGANLLKSELPIKPENSKLWTSWNLEFWNLRLLLCVLLSQLRYYVLLSLFMILPNSWSIQYGVSPV